MPERVKIIKIGNSQGIRLPKRLISKYALGEQVVLDEVKGGILLRAVDDGKLSWEDTYKQMALDEKGEWDDWQELDIDNAEYL